jgi:hypothetical protein
LDQEIRHRHLVPYLLGQKRAHPIVCPCPVTGKSFENMAFTQKKDNLMVDKERLWHSQNPEADVRTFDSISLVITSRNGWLLSKRLSMAWSVSKFCCFHECFLLRIVSFEVVGITVEMLL